MAANAAVTSLRPTFIGAFPVASQPHKLIIYASNSIISHQHIKDILPSLELLNIQPVIFIMPDSRSPKAKIPSLMDYSYYEADITREIYPLLDTLPYDQKYQLAASFERAARAYGAEIIAVTSLQDPVIAATYAADDMPIIGSISVYQDQIFKDDIIAMAKDRGFFWNLHPAVLPDNRGLYLAFWSMLNGNTMHGYTLHEIDAGIDTGNIIARYQAALDPKKSVVENYFDFVPAGSRLLETALLDYLQEGHVDTLTFPNHASSYFSFPTEEDIAAVRAQNIALVGTPERMALAYTRLFGYHPSLYNHIKTVLEERAASNDSDHDGSGTPASGVGGNNGMAVRL